MSEFEINFNFFWERCVLNLINEAQKEFDQDFVKSCNLRIAYDDIAEYKNILMDCYKRKRNWLKEVYLPHIDSPKLDMHKLGAVMCRALIAKKVFSFDYNKAEQYVINRFPQKDLKNNTEWFFQNIYINYKIAFYASVGMIYLKLLNFYKDSFNEVYDFLLKKHTSLFFYPKSQNHESFENSTMLLLQKNDVLGRNFDYLSYALMLFQLERYNMSILANNFPELNLSEVDNNGLSEEEIALNEDF